MLLTAWKHEEWNRNRKDYFTIFPKVLRLWQYSSTGMAVKWQYIAFFRAYLVIILKALTVHYSSGYAVLHLAPAQVDC